VTVCCQNRKNIFGEIIKKNVGAGLVPALMENNIILNDVGIIVEKIILEYFNKNKLIELDEYIIMPDHVHMIVVIKNQFNKNIMNEIDNIMNDKINNGMNIKTIVDNGTINKMIGDETINTMSGDEINTRAGTRPAPTPNKTLGLIIGELKSLIINEYIKNIKQNNWPRFDKRLWQRNYFERIIRNEKEYLIYKNYIRDNPINFEK